eukprot:TRINITY_DN10005_c0_g1_i3.p1 TRINITY_DN10005_c0_g1~~TRINITY_DN10005_c0_g1_i3.p1  ORF type:complete len:330 (+),score=36.33 TRINITY_DN10005_c0_g1_i3:35-991(+)
MAVKILEKMSSLSTHSNRFVREAAFGIIEIVINTNHVAEHPTTLPSIAKGLTDNWSQVRYRATHAMKAYLTHHKDPSTYPIVLPRLCLNRYYIAEGVRLETQRLWVAVCGTSGVQLVSENLEHFVKYYGEQIKEKNHAVREAACHCVAELVTKVPGVGKYVGVLLNMIDEACDDPSWPVRDIACVSASKILLKYPEECAGMVEGIYKRFLYQAEDPIPSVRQHAGEALANFAKVDKSAPSSTTPSTGRPSSPPSPPSSGTSASGQSPSGSPPSSPRCSHASNATTNLHPSQRPTASRRSRSCTARRSGTPNSTTGSGG